MTVNGIFNETNLTPEQIRLFWVMWPEDWEDFIATKDELRTTQKLSNLQHLLVRGFIKHEILDRTAVHAAYDRAMSIL